MIDLAVARDRARLHRQLLDGLGETGMFHTTAQRGRLVVDDLLDALDELEAARSARATLQERCARQETIIAGAAYRSLTNPDAREEFEAFEFGEAA